MPHWKHRRRLVYATVAVCALMLTIGAFDADDRQVSSQLVIGAVSLWTVVLTSYVFGAALDDKWQRSGDAGQLSDLGEADGGAGGGGVGGGAGGEGWD